MDNGWKVLLEELQDGEEQVIHGIIIPMIITVIAFTGGLLIGAIFA